MSTDPSAAHNGVPPLTLGWRLQMALREADLSVQEMADYIGYSRGHVSKWLNDKEVEPPRTAVLRMWALRCGVDYAWLTEGRQPPAPGPTGGGPTPPNSDGWPSLDDPSATKLFTWGHAA